MKSFNPNILNYSKLYSGSPRFNAFREMSENDLYEIEENVNYFKSYEHSEGAANYEVTINYLINSQIYRKSSFDVKMAFIILCCDPCLVHFQNFINTSIIPKSEVETLEYIYNINKVKKIRQQQIEQLRNKIIYQVGFYDSNLINIEFLFFKKFYNDKILINNVELDMIDELSKLMNNYYLLNKISEQKIKDVIKYSDNYMNYLLDNDYKLSINTLTFNILHQSEILGLENYIEKVLFIILTIDREFKATEYYDNLNLTDRQYEIENLIGFYDEKFINAEKILKKQMINNKI